MMYYIAHGISYLLHPLLMPSYGLLILFTLFNFGLGSTFEKIILVTVFSGTFLLPASFIPFYKYYKIISNIHMNDKRERLVPILFTLFLYFFTFLILRRLPLPYPILAFIFSSLVSLFITFVITLYWKISVHMIGMGGLIGLIFSIMIYYKNIDYLFIMPGLILLSGILGTSRLYLKAHDNLQVYVGFFSGIIMVLIFFAIYISLV